MIPTNRAILVTGAGGMMGSHLLDIFSEDELFRTDLVESPGIQPMNIRDSAEVMGTVASLRPRMVIHMAAETDVDRCELDPDHAYRSNLIGTLNMTLACQKHGIDLVYVSTAGVFDGNKAEPYVEFDAPAPINHYARAKFEGEQIVQSLHSRHYIVRAGWVFGGRERDKKFVGKIASICLEKGAEAEIRAVDDKRGSPTYARDFLETIKVLSASGYYGLYHGVNTGCATRYDVALKIAQIMGTGARVVPTSSDSFVLPAPRPQSEAARNYKLELLGIHKMQNWQDALQDYLASWILKPVKTVAAAYGG